jgi:hypothetical protein
VAFDGSARLALAAEPLFTRAGVLRAAGQCGGAAGLSRWVSHRASAAAS